MKHYAIATIANKERERMGARKGIENIFNLLEEDGIKVFRYPLGKDSILGAAALIGNDKVIITNSSLILSREIFTAAHELGHHLLHLNGGDRVIVDTIHPDESGTESDADYFAASFLMPKHIIERFIMEDLTKKEEEELKGFDIAMIQCAFHVSFEAAVRRLHSIKAITSENKKALEMEKAENTASAFMKAIRGNETLFEPSEVKCMPAELLKMIVSNYEKRLVPFDNVKKIFGNFDIPLTYEKEPEAAKSDTLIETKRTRKRMMHESHA